MTCKLSLGLAAAIWAIAFGAQAFEPPPSPVAAGRLIAERDCSACHAIGRKGDSPHVDAPPFRTLSERYPVDSLEEALAEGIVVGHKDMPRFELEPAQIDALLTYLKSIQPKR